jgi:hypothetical protein
MRTINTIVNLRMALEVMFNERVISLIENYLHPHDVQFINYISIERLYSFNDLRLTIFDLVRLNIPDIALIDISDILDESPFTIGDVAFLIVRAAFFASRYRNRLPLQIVAMSLTRTRNDFPITRAGSFLTSIYLRLINCVRLNIQ